MKKLIFVFLILTTSATWSAPIKKIIIIGDSITEGYGVDSKKAYPALLAGELKKNKSFKNIELQASAIAGSMTASAPNRLEYLLKNEKDLSGVMVVLGGNDLLRGVKPEVTSKSLNKIVAIAEREKLPLLIATMPIPMNYSSYQKEFDKIYQQLSESKQVTLLNNFLRGVIGVPALNQTDGIHPNEVGHTLIVKNIQEQVTKWIKSLPKK